MSRVRESGCSRGCANNHNPSLECSNRYLGRKGEQMNDIRKACVDIDVTDLVDIVVDTINKEL